MLDNRVEMWYDMVAIKCKHNQIPKTQLWEKEKGVQNAKF